MRTVTEVLIEKVQQKEVKVADISRDTGIPDDRIYLRGVKLPLLGKRQSLRMLKRGAHKIRLVYLLKLRTLVNLESYLKTDKATVKRLANRYTRMIKIMDAIIAIDDRDIIA